MRYIVLATDYDGTLARQGHVDNPALTALEKVRQSGRKLILVTGRHLPDLQSVFSRLELFDRAVLENGALLYTPQTKQEQVLCEPPPLSLQQALRQRNVPFSVGTRNSRQLGAESDRGVAGDSRSRPRLAGHLQQRRGHGIAVGHKQSERAEIRAG